MVHSISILGSTGSIGRQTVAVAEHLGLNVRALTTNRNIQLAEEQARVDDAKKTALNFIDVIEQDIKGHLELLEKLKAAGIKISVLSNKPHAQAVDVVETLFGKGYFDAVQGQTDSVPRKPSPIGANRLAEHFRAEKKDCLYIGDTATDMETGKAAEMETVGVLWGFRDRKELEESKACHIAEKPEEIFLFAMEKED